MGCGWVALMNGFAFYEVSGCLNQPKSRGAFTKMLRAKAVGEWTSF